MKARSFFLAITIIILTLGCKSEEMDITVPHQFTYLALGDSYTIGQGVSEHDRYPVQLRDSLVKLGITIDKPQIIAQTGWTTTQLSTSINSATLTTPYNLVTLLIGVNNQYRGLSIDDYREEFAALLTMAIGFAGNDKSRVVVLSIPDWGVTPFAEGRDREKIAMEIDAFNAVNLDETQKAGVAYVDVTPISREAANRPELVASDNLHPSDLMYRYWVDDLFPIAFEILKNQQ